MNEEWKDVVGYEGLYCISSEGRVKSFMKYPNGKIMSLKTNKYGYVVIGFCLNNERKFYLVHRLVAQAFIDNSDNLPQVNHKDEDKSNNHYLNLEWCDAQYNNTYNDRHIKYKDKISKPVYGISNDQFNVWYYFESTQEAGRQLNICQGDISRCCNGDRKSAGNFKWFYYQ